MFISATANEIGLCSGPKQLAWFWHPKLIAILDPQWSIEHSQGSSSVSSESYFVNMPWAEWMQSNEESNPSWASMKQIAWKYMFGLSAQNFFFSEGWIVTTVSWVPYGPEDSWYCLTWRAQDQRSVCVPSYPLTMSLNCVSSGTFSHVSCADPWKNLKC